MNRNTLLLLEGEEREYRCTYVYGLTGGRLKIFIKKILCFKEVEVMGRMRLNLGSSKFEEKGESMPQSYHRVAK